MDETLRQWGENIRYSREALNTKGELRSNGEQPLTQEQLGQMLDPPVGQSTVARWERGYMEPRRQYKAQLAQALCTDARMLFPMRRAG